MDRFLGKGAEYSQTSKCPKYCLFVSTTCRQCLQLADRVYLWCTVSTDYTRVNVYVHSVYKLCTVSTYIHGVYRPYIPARIRVYVRIREKVAYTSRIRIHVYVYAYTYARKHMRENM